MAQKKVRATVRKKKTIPPVESVPAPIQTSETSSSGKLNFIFLVFAVVCVGLFFWKKNNLSAQNFRFNLKLFKKDFPITELTHIEVNKLKGGPFNVWGLCAIGKDKIGASDDIRAKIMVFDGSGNLLRSFGKNGPLKTDLQQIRGISSDSNGNLYALDTGTAFIFGFTVLGKPLRMINTSPTGFFYGPVGLWCVGDNFAIADTGSHRVVTVDRHGKTVSSWGSHGTGRDDFQSPRAVLVDARNRYYVADYDNERVKIESAKGEVLKIISLGNKPVALALDQENRLYVGFENEGFIQVYSAPTGDYIGDVVVKKPEQDESYKNVHALCVTGDGKLVSADSSNIWIYRLPSPTGN